MFKIFKKKFEWPAPNLKVVEKQVEHNIYVINFQVETDTKMYRVVAVTEEKEYLDSMITIDYNTGSALYGRDRDEYNKRYRVPVMIKHVETPEYVKERMLRLMPSSDVNFDTSSEPMMICESAEGGEISIRRSTIRIVKVLSEEIVDTAMIPSYSVEPV